MKFTFTLITCLFSFAALAQPVSLDWVKQMGGNRYDSGNALESDDAGNLYVAGGFQDVADFDPGPNTTSLTGQIIETWNQDVFIGKYDSQGDLLWVQGFTGTLSKGAKDIELDAAGNVWTSGWFTGTVQFGQGSSFTFSTPQNTYQTFVAKMDSDGNILWVKVFSHSTDGYGTTALETDQFGNCVITGLFTGTGDFDPGTGVVELTATGSSAGFIMKLNEAGEFVWAKAILDSVMSYGLCLDVDEIGNIYASGSFYSTADLDPGPGVVTVTSLGEMDTYLLKLDPNGNFLWEKHFGGVQPDQATTLNVSDNGNLYLTGVYGDGNTDVDPSPEEFILPFNNWVDFYILKLDSSGNFVWAEGIGGSEYDCVNSIILDDQENMFLAGRFRTDVDFDPGPGTYMMSSLGAGSDDGFILRMDQNGNFVWADQIHGNMNYIIDIDFTPEGDLYATGNFGSQTDFAPGTELFNATPVSGYPDAFIFKWSEAEGVSVPENSSISNLSVFPNPFQENLTIRFENRSGDASVKFYNNMGELVLEQTNLSNNYIVTDTRALASGLYLIEIQDGNAVEHVKVVK